MIELTIKHTTQDKQITIYAETMNQLIDEKLPEWIPNFEDDLVWLKRTREYKKRKDAFLEEEKNSGWYYEKK